MLCSTIHGPNVKSTVMIEKRFIDDYLLEVLTQPCWAKQGEPGNHDVSIDLYSAITIRGQRESS